MKLMDKRQRAMLKEMGVRVWQPVPEAAPVAHMTTPAATLASPANKPEIAIDLGAVRAGIHLTAAPFKTQKQPLPAVPAAAQAENSVNTPAWRVGAAQMLYADTSIRTTARWLVLVEAPASALQDGFNPLDGDAGKLLDNMLRAAKLNTAAAVLLAPLVRAGTGGDLPGVLTELLASAKADVVLVMGRLAAQAMLQSAEPLPKLRGQIHTVQNQQTIVTFAPTYLLGNPLEKAKAWGDLCLALSLT